MSEPSRGVVYIAVGGRAYAASLKSEEALGRVNDYTVFRITDSHLNRHFSETLLSFQTNKIISRWAKTNLYRLSPFDYTLYIDSDTFPDGDVSPGFQALADGWDMVITPSSAQGIESMWHIKKEERKQTVYLYGTRILQLQGGVIYFKKNKRTNRFFKAWFTEWLNWKDEDQGALLRAMYHSPVKYFLFGRPFNGGPVIRHTFARMED